MPVQFRATEASGAEAWPSEDWWRGFRSPELTALIEQARAQNFDLAAAIARVRQADAQVRIAGAALLPNVTATASASWQQTGATRGFTGVSRGGSTNSTIDIRDYSLTPLNVAYEVDFWGKNRAARQSADVQRDVQPLRPAGGRADGGDQRGQYLVHRAGAGGSAGRRAAQPGRCRTDAGGDPRPARRRHRQRARRGPAGIAGGRRAGDDTRPAQPARTGADRSRHPGRPPARGDHGPARLAQQAGAAAGRSRPALQRAAAPPRRGRGRGPARRGELRHQGGTRRVLSVDPAHRVVRLLQRGAEHAVHPRRDHRLDRRRIGPAAVRRRAAARAARTGQRALRRAAGRLPQGGGAGLHRRRGCA